MIILEIFKELVRFHSDNAKSINTGEVMVDSIKLTEQLLSAKIS